MNALANITGSVPLTMSSREIADLVNSRHDKVRQSIERLVERGTIVQPPVGDEQISDVLGRPRSEKVYNLTKRDSYVVVAQLSPEFTARLVDRWQELEEQASRPNLNDPTLLRSLLLENVEKVLALQGRVEEMQTSVDALDRIADANGSFNRTEAAKQLGVPPAILIRWMKTNAWTYRRPGSKDDLAYQSKISAGYLEHKISTGPRPDGTEWASTQVRVTPKGLTVLAKAFPRAAEAAE